MCHFLFVNIVILCFWELITIAVITIITTVMMMMMMIETVFNFHSAVWFHTFHWPGKSINVVTRTHEVRAHVYVCYETDIWIMHTVLCAIQLWFHGWNCLPCMVNHGLSCLCSQDGIVLWLGYGLEDAWFDSRQGKEIFPLSVMSGSALGPTKFNWYWRLLPQGKVTSA